MVISTVSFDKAKIYKNKMFFYRYGKNAASIQVFDDNGTNLVNIVSHKPHKIIQGDILTINKKKEYEIPKEGIFFQNIKRMYNKFGELIDVKKEILKV